MVAKILLILMAIGLSSCATVPMASLKLDDGAKKFEAVPKKAKVYFYRSERLGLAVSVPISVDGKIAGRTAAKTYFQWNLPPGKHEFSSHAEDTSTITIEGEPGKIYYIWQEMKMGLATPRTQLHEVSEEIGKKGVLECFLAN